VKSTAGLVALLIVVASVAMRAGAAESAATDKSTFKGGIDLVALSVTVTNRAEKHVAGLRVSPCRSSRP
jgi:hypothetical protein